MHRPPLPNSLASRALSAVERWPEWIRARSEEIFFEDVDLIRRTIRIDLSIPEELAEPVEGLVQIPVAFVPKTEVDRLEIRDEAGNRVLALTSGENRFLAREMLLRVFGWEPVEEDAGFLSSLTTVAFEEPEIALEALDLVLRRYGPTDTEALEGEFSILKGLLPRIAEDELIFIALPAGSGNRRILTLSYQEDLDQPPNWNLRLVDHWWNWVHWTYQALGWRDRPLHAVVRDLGTAPEVSVAMRVPEGVVVRGGLVVTTAGSEAVQFDTFSSIRLKGMRTFRVALQGEQWSTAGAQIFVRAEILYPLVILVSSLFSALMLALGLLALERLNGHTDAAVTLLLAGPTLFASLAAQPRKGSLGVKVVQGARVLIGVVAASTFAAAGVLIALPYGSAQRSAWAALTTLVWLATCLLATGIVIRVSEVVAARRYARASASP